MSDRLWTAVAPWLTAATLLGLAVWAWSWQAVAFDDAYITFRYAENALAGHGLVYEPGGERVEGYSNPLWLALAWGTLLLQGDPFAVARAVGVASYAVGVAAIGFGLARHARAVGPGGLALAPALACLVLPTGLAAISGSGLETGFHALCLISLGLTLLLEDDSEWGAPLCVVLSVAAVATRLDAALAVVAVTAADFVRRDAARWSAPNARARLRLGAMVAAIGTMFVFRLVYYDAWLPNPYYAKGADELHLAAGLAYLGGFVRSAWQVVPLLALAAFGAWGARSSRLARVCVYALLCAAGYALYIAKVGGDFMQYRFAWPPYLVLAAGGLVGLAELARRQLAPAAVVSLVIGALSVLPPVLEREWAMQSLEEMDGYTRLGLEVGRALDRVLPPRTQVATTLAGTLAYRSRLRIVDQWGLNDREVARGEPLERFQRGHYKPASPDYLRGRGVELVVNHPVVCPCDAPCTEPVPMLFVRMGDGRCIQGFLLAPSRQLLAKACSEPEHFLLHRVDCTTGRAVPPRIR